MLAIRTCTMISQLIKHNTKVLRFGQEQYVRFYPKRAFSHAPQTMQGFLKDKRNYCQIKDSSRDTKPEGRTRVYYGLLTPQIRTVKWFSLSTSVMGLIAQPFLYKELSALNSMALLIAGCSVAGIFTFVTPFLLHFVAKKYVTQLEYNPAKDTYIATTINFFCMSKETEFKVDEVTVPDIPGMFTTLLVKDKALFLEPRSFKDLSHYARIMGFDKPMDFKLYSTSSDNKK